MTDQAKDLKPCPFCGGEARLNQHEGSASNIDDINAGAQWIECTKCGASTNLRFSLLDDCRPLLAEQWNRRASATSAPVQPDHPGDAANMVGQTLTDKQIDAVFQQVWSTVPHGQRITAFARAIESAVRGLPPNAQGAANV